MAYLGSAEKKGLYDVFFGILKKKPEKFRNVFESFRAVIIKLFSYFFSNEAFFDKRD